MADDENETYRLWLLRKTVLQMCHDRGYLVMDNELHLTLNQFKEAYGDSPSERRPARSDLTILVARTNDPKDQMYVFFPDDPKIGINVIREIFLKMQEQNISRAIIVIQTGMTPSAKQEIASLASEIKIEHFLEAELMMKITEDELMPEHVGMNSEERAESLAPSSSEEKENQLPPAAQKTIQKKSTRKVRYRPGEKALNEIRKFQKTVRPLVPRAPFSRLCREIVVENAPNRRDLRIQSEAISALQEASEAFLVTFFEAANRCAIHAHRITVTPADLQLLRWILNAFGINWI